MTTKEFVKVFESFLIGGDVAAHTSSRKLLDRYVMYGGDSRSTQSPPDEQLGRLKEIMINLSLSRKRELHDELCAYIGRVMGDLMRRCKSWEEFWPHLDSLELSILQSDKASIGLWTLLMFGKNTASPSAT